MKQIITRSVEIAELIKSKLDGVEGFSIDTRGSEKDYYIVLTMPNDLFMAITREENFSNSYSEDFDYFVNDIITMS